jgi:hypothetical protein
MSDAGHIATRRRDRPGDSGLEGREMSETNYAVVDAGGEYLAASGGRTPASDEAATWETREDAEASCERATDRVVAWTDNDE